MIGKSISIKSKWSLSFMVLVLAAIPTGHAAAGQASGVKHAKTPVLATLPGGTVKLIASGHKGDRNVLDYSGMTYDALRHKILAFGGGHATANFPNSVHEFDIASMKWTQLTEDVPPSAHNAENALKTKSGDKLGGIKWKGKIHAGSRHTYGGLVMIPGTSLMAVGTSMEFRGAASQMPQGGKLFRANYQGGSGLWVFDPLKKEWRVSKQAKLVSTYGAAAIDPKQPDWIYHFGWKKNHMINWKTEETKKIPRAPLAGFVGVTFNPDDRCFYSAPCPCRQPKNLKIMKFDIAKNKWQTLTPTGDAPSTYDIDIVYNRPNKVFVCFSKGYAYYYSTSENKWYKLEKLLDKNLNNGPMRHRHIYDPVNDVHIITADRWKTFAFKLSDTPGKLPGTRSK
jgi:hypothetical protein